MGCKDSSPNCNGETIITKGEQATGICVHFKHKMRFGQRGSHRHVFNKYEIQAFSIDTPYLKLHIDPRAKPSLINKLTPVSLYKQGQVKQQLDRDPKRYAPP